MEKGDELSGPQHEMEEFISVAAHDLKAPLRAIENLSQWIEEDLGTEPKPVLLEHLGLLRQRLLRMNRLIDGLLAYVRLPAKAYPVEHVDISLSLAALWKRLQPPAGFELKLAEGLPAWRARSGALEAVLSELLANALKHHDRPEGSVSIEAREAGDWVEINVSDDGPGIAAEQLERVFKLGQTLKPKDEVEGNGVGLALAKKICGAQGASLELVSSGRGCRAVLRWPKQPAAQALTDEA